MPIKSNNTQGNPYHDESGKFTSADSQGSGKEEDIKLTPEQKQNPFKGSKLPGAKELENAWGNLFGSMQDVLNKKNEEKEASKLLGVDVQEEEEDKTPIRYPDGTIEIGNIVFRSEGEIKEKRGPQALEGLRDATEEEIKDRARLDKIISERGLPGEDREWAKVSKYFGYGSLDALEEAHGRNYARKEEKQEELPLKQGPANVIKKLTPAEREEKEGQYRLEQQLKDMDMYNMYPDEEEKQASKLLGVDMSDEDKEYYALDKEPTIDIPYSINLSNLPPDWRGEDDEEIEVPEDKFLDMLKKEGVNLTPVEEEYFRNNRRLPVRIFDNLRIENEDDLEEWLRDVLGGSNR